jgi:hypothetical protein
VVESRGTISHEVDDLFELSKHAEVIEFLQGIYSMVGCRTPGFRIETVQGLSMLTLDLESNLYPNRSEAIRIAIRDLLKRELWGT